MSNKKMKKSVLISFIFILLGTRCFPQAQKIVKHDGKIFSSATLLAGKRLEHTNKRKIKRINEMLTSNGHLYTISEYPNGWGQTIMESYLLDSARSRMIYEREYGKRPSGSYTFESPSLFLTDKDSVWCADKAFGNIYCVSDSNVSITKDYILSIKAKVPYPISFTANNIYQKKVHEYFFWGHQPGNGSGAVFHASKFSDSLVIKEVLKTIYDVQYQSWEANYGVFSYDRTRNVGCYAYRMYPTINFFCMNGEVYCSNIFQGKPFNPQTLKDGDTWDMNPSYFITLVSSVSGVYALYWGQKYTIMKEQRKRGNVKSWILHFDWNGNLINTFCMSKLLMNFSVDESEHSIIAFDGTNFWSFEIKE